MQTRLLTYSQACDTDVRTSPSCLHILQSHWRENIKDSVDWVSHIYYPVTGIDICMIFFSINFTQQIIVNQTVQQ